MTKHEEQNQWRELRGHYRRRVMRVLQDVRRGIVNEVDLDKLHNFCAVSLMLMAKVEEPTWRAAERQAELASLLHDQPLNDSGEYGEGEGNETGCTDANTTPPDTDQRTGQNASDNDGGCFAVQFDESGGQE